MVIAVDFDGTIVEHKYPKIGKEIPFAIDTLKALQAEGHTLILWSYRAGEELEEAVKFCEVRGLEFFACNRNYPDEKYVEGKVSRKILADLYIDDRSFGGLPDWGEMYESILKKKHLGAKKKKKKFFGFIG
ncbi:BT0820 family HAD-type phosphatase [Aureibacter tunicatorum]|uniref:Hydroxymethylpyrimidine pyrophosphatase-like HAD family hydrolase n=1 Tax=Aureibacter tunicatorum TaxID=866807 RepID=A0AAE3XRT8_9BACT|nr:hydrolase [Aureibacter tunicatorum]MDR6240780.1 hydroxymethylpyrimidine pyrophosphatase-like HAD family hydrolase [Aureibacter tunicatorum]BDD06887.1 hypothetical protein AUTU_43700 [Aureibacter tunicatorum]